MSWKTNHILLAEQLVKRISEDGESTFDKLEARALQLGVSMNIFDQAIALIHKMKSVKRVSKLGTVKYSIQELKKKVQLVKTYISLAEYEAPARIDSPWCFDESGRLIDPFPEIDVSYIFLKPEALEKYKAELKGRTFIPKSRYANTRTSS